MSIVIHIQINTVFLKYVYAWLKSFSGMSDKKILYFSYI